MGLLRFGDDRAFCLDPDPAGEETCPDLSLSSPTVGSLPVLGMLLARSNNSGSSSSFGFCPGSGYTENPSGDGGAILKSLTLLALILDSLRLIRDFVDFGEDCFSPDLVCDRSRPLFLSPLFLVFELSRALYYF